MRINKLNLLIAVTLICFLHSNQFEAGRFYCFEDNNSDKKGQEAKSRDLFRGQMNKNNQLVSAEMLKDYTAGGKTIREIIIFEFDTSASSSIWTLPNSGLALRRYGGIEGGSKHYGYFLEWSKAKNNLFSYVSSKNHSKWLRKAYYSIKKNTFLKLKSLNDDPNIFSNSFFPEKIVDYSIILNEGGEKPRDGYLIHYLNNSGHFIRWDINGDFSSNDLLFESSKSGKLKTPNNVDIHYDSGIYDALITFIDESTAEDIYYFCNIHLDPVEYENRALVLSPNSPVPLGNQTQATFSYNGEYIAFLNEDTDNDLKDVFDLYTFNYEDRDEFCNASSEENLVTYSDSYRKIDSDIANIYKMGHPPEIGLDYAWHPTKNIIFYIKKEPTKGKEFRYILSYHDLERDDGSVQLLVSTGTLFYPSISRDGQYLLFSFLGKPSGTKFENIPSDCINCCSDADVYRIGVMELVEK